MSQLSKTPLVVYLKNLFFNAPKNPLPSANTFLQPWLAALKQHLKLHLQCNYVDKKHQFFADLFTDSHKQTAFANLLFASDSSLQDILLHQHLTSLLKDHPQDRLAMQTTYFSIIKPLEGFNPTILDKPAKHPQCNALLQQLLKNFAKVYATLLKASQHTLLLPILKDAYQQLATLAQHSVDLGAPVEMTALYRSMQQKAAEYLQKHPLVLRSTPGFLRDKTVVNDGEQAETAKHIVDNTLQFP
jgi:hypothetical protein